MEIPACFERKKGKTGPSRVCDSCRYRVVNGAKLVEKLSGPAARGTPFNRGPAAAPAGLFGAASGPALGSASGSAAGSGSGSGPAAHASAQAQAQAQAQPLGLIGAGGLFRASGGDVIHAVVQREADGAVVAKIAIPGSDTSLATIDVLLKKTAPQGEPYSYVFRGAPIPDAFFGVFFARHLGTTLWIRPKQRADLVSLQEEEGEEFPGGSGGDAAVHSPSNPFNSERLANLDAARALASGRRLRPKAEPKPLPPPPVVVFKRPVPKQVVKFDVAKALSGAATPNSAPSVLPGANLDLGGTGDEVFKRRAKALFGDKPK